MTLQGGCRCGAVRYEVEGDPVHAALCHCIDCRKSSGAPMMAWAAFPADRFRVTGGEAVTHNSSGASMRCFCGTCGSGLWFTNAEMLPGLVDIQIVTLDTPEAIPPGANIQVAERLHWMETAHDLPAFDRYPG